MSITVSGPVDLTGDQPIPFALTGPAAAIAQPRTGDHDQAPAEQPAAFELPRIWSIDFVEDEDGTEPPFVLLQVRDDVDMETPQQLRAGAAQYAELAAELLRLADERETVSRNYSPAPEPAADADVIPFRETDTRVLAYGRLPKGEAMRVDTAPDGRIRLIIDDRQIDPDRAARALANARADLDARKATDAITSIHFQHLQQIDAIGAATVTPAAILQMRATDAAHDAVDEVAVQHRVEHGEDRARAAEDHAFSAAVHAVGRALKASADPARTARILRGLVDEETGR